MHRITTRRWHFPSSRIVENLFFNCVGRVGDAKPKIETQRGMDSLDASSVDTSLMGHSYIGNTRSVLADVAALISDNRDPDNRFGYSRRANRLTYGG